MTINELIKKAKRALGSSPNDPRAVSVLEQKLKLAKKKFEQQLGPAAKNARIVSIKRG